MKRSILLFLLVSFIPSLTGTYAQDYPAGANVIFFSAGKLQDAELFDRVKQILSNEGYTTRDEDRENLQITAIPGNRVNMTDEVKVKLIFNISGYSVAIRTFIRDATGTGNWTRVVDAGGKDSIQKEIWTHSYDFAKKLRERLGGDITTRSEPL
ncbi:MAG TPA: hypothetical protein VE870_10145 [Bacteroidales bacterium]|nr:hypothetical protein [Bacteroidales bacterium]